MVCLGHPAPDAAQPRGKVPFVTRARTHLRFAALALLACAGCLRAVGTADEPAVVSLDLEGVKKVDRSELEEKLATKASDRAAWGEVRKLDPDALAYDLRRIVAFYKEHGYYRATVDEPEVRPDGEGRVKIVIRVHEGEPIRVTRVDVQGLDAAPEARDRARKLALQPGQIFTWAAYDATRAQLQSALGSTGWADGKVTASAVVKASEGVAEVTYQVEAGRRYRFGPVTVKGTVEVPEGKVAGRATRVVKPGDFWDERRLDEIQSRVLELGVFSGVRVTRGTPAPDGDELPLDVTVREAPFRTVRVGPGVGLQPSKWEVLGQATWIHRNWLGDLRQLRLDIRGGYAWIPSPFSPIREGVVGKGVLAFTQPAILGDSVDFGTSVELEKSLEQAYASTSEKFRIGTPLRPAPRWTFAPSYNFEIYQLTEVVGDPANLPVQNCPSELCVLSYLEERITWDRRDNPILTTEGTYLSLSLQEGFPTGGQGYVYFRFMPEARFFEPLGPQGVLAVRARLGAIVPAGEKGPAPLVALFTGGGSNSMRGYGGDRLSPMVNQEGNWVPTGGNGLFDGSVEVRRTISGNLIGAVFLDWGNVSVASAIPSQWKDVLDLSTLQGAFGLGVRYRTAVGPFRADLGMRLPNDLSKGVPFEERFPPVPGNSGHREPIAVLHVALGEAF